MKELINQDDSPERGAERASKSCNIAVHRNNKNEIIVTIRVIIMSSSKSQAYNYNTYSKIYMVDVGAHLK